MIFLSRSERSTLAGVERGRVWCNVWVMRYIYFAVLLVCTSLPATAAPPTAKLISVKKIGDQAPHCAFTDLAFWKGHFVCAFREGRAHVATDGKIRILSSPDGETWSPSALLTLEGFDLRDAGLSVTPDDRLMLIGGAAPRKNEKDLVPTGSFVAFSDDGIKWTKPQIVSEPGRWLWRVNWHDGKAYGISYSSFRGRHSGASHTSLLVSDDGIQYRELVPKLFDEGTPTEATVRFDDDGTMYCLQRRDGMPRWKSAYVRCEPSALHRMEMARFGDARWWSEFHPAAIWAMDRCRAVFSRQEAEDRVGFARC